MTTIILIVVYEIKIPTSFIRIFPTVSTENAPKLIDTVFYFLKSGKRWCKFLDVFLIFLPSGFQPNQKTDKGFIRTDGGI